MASLVEFVEALSIVLAVGAVRGWRSALLGTAASLAALMLLVAVAGPALARIPLPVAQVVVGTLLASIGAGLALLAVVALGVWLHRPLANVPENALKFGVGVMLAAFGTFWAGEGIGLSWPGEDWAILALIGVFAVVALAMVHLCKRLRKPATALSSAAAGARPPARGRLAMVAEEVMGLFVDDGWLAIGVVAWVTASWEMGTVHAVAAARAGPLFAVGLTVLLAASAVRRARA
ncbi:hypothetical protein LJR296_004099 [Cupriavidus necator]|uniref:hypothetical protein n=1 Tax=Cupriavidus necator TaxID=106590 RepID=UPI003ED08995